MDDDLARIRMKKVREMEERIRMHGVEEVVPLTTAEFADAVHAWPALVVDCWAEWCGPCRSLTPVIHELAREYAGRIVFASVDTDHEPAIARQYGISAIPTLLLFRDGNLVGRLIGAYPMEPLRAHLEKVFFPGEE